MKCIVLCADDYGQAPAISQGILALLQQNRLSAVTCMVNSPYWSLHADWIKPFTAQADIGLHFNLTEGRALSAAFKEKYGTNFPRLSTVLRRAFFRQWDVSVIESECHAQLDTFEAKLGCLPRFIDGHQHVHQFPVIREAWVRVYEKRLHQTGTYMRWVDPKLSRIAFIKKIVIYLIGSKAWGRLLREHDIPHNTSFSGIYDFNKSMDYADLFKVFLDEVGEDGLIMCHPGFKENDEEDKIRKARADEYAYFSSEQFIQDCTDRNIVYRNFR